MKGPAGRGSSVSFGDYGLKTLDSHLITREQIESARRTITHHTKRVGKLWLRVFPHKPTTKKAAGSKMGSGKGDIDTYKAVVRRGAIIFELGSVPEDVAREAFRKASSKLPVKTAFVERGAL
jgi:large subunit ribosomal protein L16